MAVLFCDTDCELWYTTAKDLGLKVIQMPYIIDGEEIMYDLGENTDFDGFFNKMKNGAKVSTAGLNYHTYYEIFEPYFNYKTCQLFEDAPNEAVEALKQFRKTGKEYTNPDNI